MKITNGKNDRHPQEVKPDKKLDYQKPRLKKLGTLRDLTTGGSGSQQENTADPDQSQPNRYP
jgi:hypothetical protein